MYIVRKCEPRPSPTPIAEISTDPQDIHLLGAGGFQYCRQHPRPAFCRILQVPYRASIRVWVEHVVKTHLSQSLDETSSCHSALSFKMGL